jgi:hypothetical protein
MDLSARMRRGARAPLRLAIDGRRHSVPSAPHEGAVDMSYAARRCLHYRIARAAGSGPADGRLGCARWWMEAGQVALAGRILSAVGGAPIKGLLGGDCTAAMAHVGRCGGL